MRKAFIAFFIAFAQWLSAETPSLNHKIASEHFLLSCSDVDSSTAQTLLDIAEKAYGRYSVDFQDEPKIPIDLLVYPSVQAFHEARGLPDAPDWEVACSSDHSIMIVSPSNPGPAQTTKRLLTILRLNVALVFIFNMPQDVPPPFWLRFGFAAIEAGYSFKYLPSDIPPLERLAVQDIKEFGVIGGYQWSYLFVSYIESRYGTHKILQLLRNYNQFAKIMGISEEDLYQQWRETVCQQASHQ